MLHTLKRIAGVIHQKSLVNHVQSSLIFAEPVFTAVETPLVFIPEDLEVVTRQRRVGCTCQHTIAWKTGGQVSLLHVNKPQPTSPPS